MGRCISGKSRIECRYACYTGNYPGHCSGYYLYRSRWRDCFHALVSGAHQEKTGHGVQSKYREPWRSEGMTKSNDETQLAGNNLALWLAEHIQEFCRTSPENNLKNKENDRACDEPLVGFSNGADPLYEFLQKDIGSPYMVPIEIFRKSFPDTNAKAGDLTVISWILPNIPATIADNIKETALPSERWARAKHFGSRFDKILSQRVIDI